MIEGGRDGRIYKSMERGQERLTDEKNSFAAQRQLQVSEIHPSVQGGREEKLLRRLLTSIHKFKRMVFRVFFFYCSQM